MATADQQSTRTNLVLYGGRDEVKELGARLQNYMPNAQKLNNLEAQAVAQIAVAHGLDPFNGEVWGIKGADGGWYGVMVGVKGLRKCARRQADQEGGHYWIDVTYANPKDYGEPETSVVAICTLRDTRSMTAYAQSLRALRDAGMPYEDAKQEVGATPRIIGIGIATTAEKSKMKIHQRAQKRAEADAIKKRYDVSFGTGVYTDGDKELLTMDANTIDIEYFDGADSQTGIVEQPKRTEGQNLQDLGFDEPTHTPATDGTKHKASGAAIVNIVAEIIGCNPNEAAQIILAKYAVSEMITEAEARAFAQGKLPAAE